MSLAARLRNSAWWRLFLSYSTDHANLPYNWNWQRRWKEADGLLRESPIVLFDVGARGVPPPELESLRNRVLRVGFDADKNECDRLNAAGGGRFFPYLVTGGSGGRSINIYSNNEYNSPLRLSERFQSLFSGPMSIEATVACETTTLDAFVASNPELSPDLLKIDTQGSEMSILEGSERLLSKVGLVEVEAEFWPMYEGQPLFGDISRFLADRDFELLYLNRVIASRRQMYSGPSRGQVLYADALFGRREDCLGNFSGERAAKYALLLCQYGHLDVAYQVLRAHPEIDHLMPGFHLVFRDQPHRIWRAVVMQYDKLLAMALHLRRYNHRLSDADRAWPSR